MQLRSIQISFIFGFMLNAKPTSKIWVFTQKSAFMQRIADYVRTGHQAYIQGVTDTTKMHATWEKLVSLHPVFDDKLKAFRAREQGFPTARLLMFQASTNQEKIHWILLVHGRTDQLTPGEKWRHAEDPHHRIYFTGYELLRVTKEGLKKPCWTWKYSQERFQDLRDSMVMSIRSRRDQDLKILIDALFGTMGFSGSREQAKSLLKLMKDEWKRRRPNEDMPDTPKLIGWVRRKSDKGIWIKRQPMKPAAKIERKNDKAQFDLLMEAYSELFKEEN